MTNLTDRLRHVLAVLVLPAAAWAQVPDPATWTVGEADCAKVDAWLAPARRTQTTAAQRLEFARFARACAEWQLSTKSLRVVADRSAPPDTARTAANEAALANLQAKSTNAELHQQAAENDNTFMGMTFGVGIGFSANRSRIESAVKAPDGTVRVTRSEKSTPRVILEAHYYAACKTAGCNEAKYGVGPFFGLAATGDRIDAFALGVMFGVKDSSKASPAGFSLGIGAVLDREVSMLAKGFEEGKPLPAGEPDVVLVKKSKWSPLLFFTRTF